MQAAKGRRLWGLLALLLVVAIATPAAASIPRDTFLEPDPQALLAAVDEASELAAPVAPVVRFIPLQQQLRDRFELLSETDLDRLVDGAEPQQLHLFAEPETRLRAPGLPAGEQPQANQWFDPGIASGVPRGPNLYQYALNNPASFSDPMGLATGAMALQMVEPFATPEERDAIAAMDASRGAAWQGATVDPVVGIVQAPAAAGDALGYCFGDLAGCPGAAWDVIRGIPEGFVYVLRDPELRARALGGMWAGLFTAGGTGWLQNIRTLDRLTPDSPNGLIILSRVEASIAQEARRILASPEFARLRMAHREGVATEVRIAGRTILYEPDAPASGMTLFGEEGFIIGREAFTSEGELIQTVLHETYRLRTSEIGATGMASQSAAAAETASAADFATRAYNAFFE